MQYRQTSLAKAFARLITLFATITLVACATVEIDPEIRFVRTPNTIESSEPSAIIGFYNRISEKPFTPYNVGVRIVSIDSVDVKFWHGAVIEPGKRQVVARFEAAGPQRSTDVALTFNARPGRQYLLRCADSAPVDGKLTKGFTFWVEDVTTREIVAGRKPATAASFEKNPKFEDIYKQFKLALAAAGP